MIISKILIGLFISFNFAIGASASQSDISTLYQTITQAEAQDLNLVIPASTPAGFKSLEINISGAGRVGEFKQILFCKSFDGVIHWDNICPDLTAVGAQTVSQAALDAARRRVDLPNYNPLDHPKNTINTTIITFAALTVVTGAGALATRILAAPAVAQQGYFAQLSRGGVLIASTQIGRGDKSKLWSKPNTARMDNFFTRVGKKISGYSPLATRIISDGNYLRSLLGPFSLLIYPVALGMGWYSTRALHQEALPPPLIFILMMMAIGVIDSFAGLLVGFAFTLSVIAAGNFDSMNSGLTVLGVCLLVFSPALLAGAFRPFRRAVWDFTSLWERITDYLLASILTGWVVQQIVLGLPGLAGLHLPLTIHAREIALWAAGLVVIRFAAEDLSLRFFPQRLISLEPEYRARTITQQVLAMLFKVTTFAVIAGKFVGFSAEWGIGVGLFAIPLLMGIFEDKFPKSAAIQRWMPTGIIEMLVMTVVGYFLAIAVEHRYPSARTYVLVSFIILSIPGFILKILALFGKEGSQDWKITKTGVKTYRILGVLALAALIYIILSGILLSNNV